MADSLTIVLRRSPTLAAGAAAGHVVALAGLWSAAVPWLASALASAAVAASLVVTLRRHALRTSPRAIVELRLDEECMARALTLDGSWLECRVDASSFVSPMLTIVNLKPRARGSMRAALIVPDCVAADAFRRLRVWLGWRCPRRQKGTLGDPQ